MTNEPADDELAKLFTEETGFDVDDFPAAILDFARAARVKWGQPSGAGEPVAWRYRMKGDLQWQYTERPEQFTHADEVQELTTPQPTHAQAGAVPLTDEQIRAMLNKHPPEDVCGWSYRMGIDDAELHHGIKGGGEC